MDFRARNKGSQAGFTLIEMSIVLVIIGLIIGGILKGQEVIESSRQKNLLVSIDSLRSATNTFYDRYQALPGDFAFATTRINAGAGYTNGDGNGIIGVTTLSGAAALAGAAANAAPATGAGEDTSFFIHLFGARLIGGVTPAAAAATSFGEGSSLPAAAFPASGFSVMYGTYGSGTNDVKTGHWLRVNKSPSSSAGVLSPKTMYALDTKSDDGLPYSGTYRSGLDSTNCGAAATGYIATDESLICTALLVIGN